MLTDAKEGMQGDLLGDKSSSDEEEDKVNSTEMVIKI